MAKFTMRRMSAGMGKGSEKLYPHLINTGTLHLEEIVNNINAATTFSVADTRGVISALVEEIARGVAQGRSVHIDGLGLFRATLKMKETAEEELPDASTHRNKTNVMIDNVTFLAEKTLKQRANAAAQLQRVMPGKEKDKVELPTEEVRRKMVKDFLQKYNYMTVSEYAKMTGMAHSSAWLELQEILKEENSFLETKGKGTHKVYILRKEA